MRAPLWLVCLLLFASPLHAQTFDYYADSVNGNDANNCTSAATACKTIAALTTKVSGQANKKIGLAANSYWREQLQIGTQGATVDGTVIRAYGSGAAPILDGADIVSPASWTKTGGLSNTYQISLTTASAAGKAWLNMWENFSLAGSNQGTLQEVASCAAVDAAPGSYFPTNVNGGSITVCIQASDGSNPATNGKTYEITTRLYGVSTATDVSTTSLATGATIDGIEARRQMHNDGSIAMYGTGSTLTHCIARLGNKHNAYVEPGAQVDRCQFLDAYFGPAGTMNLLVGFGPATSPYGFQTTNSGIGQSLTVSGIGGTSGWESHSNATYGAAAFQNIKITQSNSAALTGIAVNSLSATSAVYIDNVICSQTSSCISPSSGTWTLNNIQSVSDVANNQPINPQATNPVIVLTNSQLCGSNQQGGMIRSSTANMALTIVNTLSYIRSPSNGNGHVFDQTSTVTLNSYFNTFDGAVSNYVYNLFNGSVNPALASNDNIFNTPNNHLFLIGTAAQYNTVAAYQTGTSQDGSSTTSGSALSACTLRTS